MHPPFRTSLPEFLGESEKNALGTADVAELVDVLVVDDFADEFSAMGAQAREEVFYQDEADIDLNPRIGPCYMRRGRQFVVLTPGENEMRYVAGALNARTGRVIHTFFRSKNSGLFIQMLERLSASYRRAKKLHLILDNCIIHKSMQTQIWLRQFGSRVILHFLPPYSPEHNVIERLWKQMHDHVTRNHRHPTMKDLICAIEQFLLGVQPFPGTKVSILTMAA